MVEIDTKNITKEFGSCRLRVILTPNSPTKQMIVINTMWSCCGNSGDTSIRHINKLDDLDKPYDGSKYEVLGMHRTLKDAIKFHIETINNMKLSNCKVMDYGDKS